MFDKPGKKFSLFGSSPLFGQPKPEGLFKTTGLFDSERKPIADLFGKSSTFSNLERKILPQVKTTNFFGDLPTAKKLYLSLLIFKYSTGPELFHKISVLNRQLRDEIPVSGILTQEKDLTLRVSSKRVGKRAAR